MRRCTIMWVLALLGAVTLARGAVIPNLAPGTLIQVREGTDWSPAHFRRREGHQALVQYDDGSEEWVTADRIRIPPGTAVLPDNTDNSAANPPPAPADSSTGDAQPTDAPSAPDASDHSAAPLPSGEITINLNDAVAAPAQAEPLELIRKITPPSTDFVRIRPGNARGSVNTGRGVLVCADTPNIVYSVQDAGGDRSKLGRIDVTQPDAVTYRDLPVRAEDIRGVGDGGKYVATVVDNHDRKGPLLKQWEYDGERYHLKATLRLTAGNNNTFLSLGKAWPIGADKIVVDRARDGLYLINVAERSAISVRKHSWDEPVMSPDGQLLLMTEKDFILVVRISTLNVVATISLDGGANSVSIDPSNTFVCYLSNGQAHIANVASDETVGKVIVGPSAQSVTMLSPQYLLADCGMGSYDVYDIKTGFPFWNYKLDGGSIRPIETGQMLASFRDGRFALLNMPDSKALESSRTVDPEKYSLRPGIQICVKGDPGVFNCTADDMKRAVKSSIEAAGDEMASGDAPYVLNWTSAAGPSEQHEFRERTGPGPFSVGPSKIYTVPSTIVTVTLSKDGKTLWQNQFTYKAGDFVQLHLGQTVEDALAAAAKPSSDTLRRLGIPALQLKDSIIDRSQAPAGSKIASEGFGVE